MDWVIRVGLALFFLTILLWGSYLVCAISSIRRLEEVVYEQQKELLEQELLCEENLELQAEQCEASKKNY